MARFFIFEDDLTVAGFFQDMLAFLGHEASICSSLYNFPSDKNFFIDIDVVVLDLVMDFEFLPTDLSNKTKSGEYTGPVIFQHFCRRNNLPIIITTGSTGINRSLLDEILINHKIVDYWYKPIRFSEMEKSLENLKKAGIVN